MRNLGIEISSFGGINHLDTKKAHKHFIYFLHWYSKETGDYNTLYILLGWSIPIYICWRGREWTREHRRYEFRNIICLLI